MVDHSLFERWGLTLEQNNQPDFVAEDFNCVVTGEQAWNFDNNILAPLFCK